jgi:hypothetical protein
MLTVEASMFHLQSIILSETFYGKNAEAAENGYIFPPLSVFQRFVTHSRVQRGAQQAVTIKARVCCVLVCSFSKIVCIVFGVSVDLQNLVKIKGVP